MLIFRSNSISEQTLETPICDKGLGFFFVFIIFVSFYNVLDYLGLAGSCRGLFWSCWNVGKVTLGGIGILRFGGLRPHCVMWCLWREHNVLRIARGLLFDWVKGRISDFCFFFFNFFLISGNHGFIWCFTDLWFIILFLISENHRFIWCFRDFVVVVVVGFLLRLPKGILLNGFYNPTMLV